MKDLKKISIELNHHKCLEGDFKSENIPPYEDARSVKNILKREYDQIFITICPPCDPSLSLAFWVEDDAMDLLYVAADSVDLHTVLDWVVGGIFNDGGVVYRAERRDGGPVVINLKVYPALRADFEIEYRWQVDANVLDGFWRTIARELVSAAQQIQISRE